MTEINAARNRFRGDRDINDSNSDSDTRATFEFDTQDAQHFEYDRKDMYEDEHTINSRV